VLKRVLVVRLLPTLGAILIAASAVVAVATRPAAAGQQRLPDLDQVVPDQLVITRVGTRVHPRYRLGFRSAVSNIGAGPLIIEGHRPGPETDTMIADQVVEQEGAPQRVVSDVGRLRYVVSPDHRHWHLLGFDRYELRRAGGARVAVADRKTGFCLGDRYPDQRRAFTAAPPKPVYQSRCGLDHPEFLGIGEGISVGYGDVYNANLEGQYLPLTGLRAGRYTLVHRVNADRRLQELDYTNNAASLLLELRRRRGEPWIRVLRSCPDTDRCDRAATPSRR
jgi:hypothetical protein